MSGAEAAGAPAESAVERPTARKGPPAHRFPPGAVEPFMAGKLPNGVDFDMHTAGLLPEFTTGRFDKNGYADIDHAQWMRQCAEDGIIGTCRRCGAYLLPRRPIEHHGVFDYEGYCRRSIESTFDASTGVRTVSGCGWEFSAPRGKVMLASSSRSERRTAVRKRGNGGNAAARDAMSDG